MPPITTTKLLNPGNLRHFSLLLDDTMCDYPANTLHVICPVLTALHSFRLHSSLEDHPREFIIDDESPIWRLPRLKSLEVDDMFTVTRPILVSLSELSLRSLTLSNFSTSITAQSPRLHFPALLNLSLTASVPGLVDIMQSISFPNVTGVFLGVNNDDYESSILKHWTTFHSIYSAFPLSLRRLHIEIRIGLIIMAWTGQTGPNTLNFNAVVRFLQSLRDLREFTLNVQLPRCIFGLPELQDGDLRSLITACPQLSFFEYDIRRHEEFPRPLERDDPTLDTIFAFARAHPHLQHLCLPYVRTDSLPADPPPLEDSAKPLEGHGLLWLKITSLAGAPKDGAYLEPIVRAVDRAFPHLYEEVRRSHGPRSPLRWCLLEKELCTLHTGVKYA